MKSKLLMLGLGALLLAACSQGPQGAGQTAQVSFAPASALPALPVRGNYLPHQLIVSYRDEAALQLALKRSGATLTLRLPQLHAALLRLDTLSVGQALYALQGQTGIGYAQPNYSRTLPRLRHGGAPAAQSAVSQQGISVNPDPVKVPYFPQQWALKNTPPEGMSVVGAWDALKGAGYGVGTSSSGGGAQAVTLAYFADPLPPTADFVGQTVAGLDFNAWLSCSYPNSDTPDPGAQNLVGGKCTAPTTLGTDDIKNIQANVLPGVNYATAKNPGGEASLDASNMVANGAGVIGVAYGAQLMPMVVFGGGDGSFSGDLAYAVEIIWAVQHGATILNNSLGGAATSPVIDAALNYALASQALFVASSGDNGDALVSNPADVPGVIGVTSTGAGGNLSPDSQIAPYVRLGAPGDNIVVSAAGDFAKCDDPVACPLGVAPVTSYQYSGGTSSSSPFTAAILALMQGAYRQKFGSYMTPGAAEDLLYATATPAPAGSQRYTDFRIPNAQKAVQAVLDLSAPAAETRGAALVTVLGGSGAGVGQADVTLISSQHTYTAKTGYGIGVNAVTDPASGNLAELPDLTDGAAVFLNIAPGTYQVLVGGPETLVDGDSFGSLNPLDRLTATGSVTVAAAGVAQTTVSLPKTTFSVQLTTSSALKLAIAEPGGSGFVVAGGAQKPTSGSFDTDTAGQRYTLAATYQPGTYLIGLYTGDLQSGDAAYAQLTVTENGKTSTVNLGPFSKDQAEPPAGKDGSVPDIVQLSPGITALSLH